MHAKICVFWCVCSLLCAQVSRKARKEGCTQEQIDALIRVATRLYLRKDPQLVMMFPVESARMTFIGKVEVSVCACACVCTVLARCIAATTSMCAPTAYA